VRVTCADAGGRIAARATADLPPPERPRPGWSQQDATGWWPAVTGALRRATDDLGTAAARAISAVAVAATSGTVVAVDERGEPVAPALLHDDQRATSQAEAAARAASARWDALGFHPGSTSGLAKLGWLMTQGDVAEQARHLWQAPELVVARLTGDPDPAADWSHALKSGYDPLRGEWATEALDALGIRTGLMPEVWPPASPAGAVGTEAAEATGLPEGCLVRLGMTDGCAAQLAAGADRPGRFVTVLGTTLVVKGVSDDLVLDPGGAVYCHRHPDGWWLPGGASNTGAAALDPSRPAEELAELDRRALAHGPASCVAYPLPGTGERFPFVAPDAEGFMLGDPLDEVDHHRAVLEGVAFVERLGYAHLGSLGGSPVSSVRSAGRAGHSRAWATVRATVMRVPVAIPEHGDTAFGACVLAAAGPVHTDLAAAGEAMVGDLDEVGPAADEEERLTESFGRFVDALVERGWVDDDLAGAARLS
jgi:xylulokinase